MLGVRAQVRVYAFSSRSLLRGFPQSCLPHEVRRGAAHRYAMQGLGKRALCLASMSPLNSRRLVEFMLPCCLRPAHPRSPMPPLSKLTARATHARPLLPAALASVPYGFILVRVRVLFAKLGGAAGLYSWPHTHPIRGATLNLSQKTRGLGSGFWVRLRSAKSGVVLPHLETRNRRINISFLPG